MSDAQRLLRVPPWLSGSLRRYFDNTATIPQNAANPLFNLPVELLIHILQYLPANDIASVQTVCRTLRDVVKRSSALQFIIEAFLGGVVEGPAVASLTTSRARLDRLTDWTHARRGRHWENVWEAALPMFNAEYHKSRRIHGQTFSALVPGAHTLHFTTLPSRLTGTVLKTWSITLKAPIMDHWFDSSQEIVIVKSYNVEGFPFLVFVHQPTGDPFPGIERPIWLLRRSSDEMHGPLTVYVRILGNLILIHRHFESFRQEIRVLNWRSGKTLLKVRSDSEHHFPSRVAFLDSEHLVCTVLSYRSLPASIVVIPWRKLYDDDIFFTDALDYSTVFHLPEHSRSHKFAHWKDLPWPGNDIFCEHDAPRYDIAPENVPFFDAGRHPPLILLHLAITPDVDVDFEDPRTRRDLEVQASLAGQTTQLRFVIPGHMLASRVTVVEAAAGGSRGMRTVPWCGWGQDTRVWDGDGCELLVYGSRLFHWEVNANRENIKVVIYDFDSTESMVRDIHSGDKTRLNEIVVKPSYLPRTFRRHLQEPVVTKAPYRRLETNIEMPCRTACRLFGENCFFLIEGMSNRVSAYSL